MSPRTAAAIAARSRRTPHGKGRFDPSEPLHMTTRHAARNVKANDTPSLNGSMDDDDSRRGSLDDINVMSSQSLGSPNSTKGRRMSATSPNGAANLSFETQSSANGKLFGRDLSKPSSPVFQTTSPSRKRKRSTPTPPDSMNGIEESLVNSVTDMMERDPRDFVEVVHPDDLSDRALESDGSVDSDEQFAGDYLGATQSTENTPAATPLGSQAVSPVSEESNSDVFFPAKPKSVAKAEVAKPPEPDEADDMEDAEELVEADEADDIDDAEDGDDQAREDLEGKPRRRLAGRRRAEHHDPIIEATMRRQLQLKSTFRAIARALKPVLAEIAHKTVENLEENPTLHEQVVEYKGTEEAGIQKLLDDAWARRKAQLEAQRDWNRENLKKTRDGEAEVRRSRCELQIADLRDLQLDRLEHDLLTVARSAQLTSGEPGYETDDEGDDVVPQPQGMGYRFTRTGALDSKYDSRSRLALECEKAVRDLQTRFDMFKMLKDVHEDDRPDGMAHFTTMDSTAREAADARRESIFNTQVLADAAAERERLDNTPAMPVVPNEQAIALQVLGDIAGSLPRVTDRPATPPPPKEEAGPPPRNTPPPQMPPPQQSSHLPMSFDAGPHGMSPRLPAFGPDRPSLPPASPMHPPLSRERFPSQSPRREPMILSPTFHDRGKTLPPFHMQPRDAEQNLQHESLPPPRPLPPARDIFGRDRPHRDIFRRDILQSEPPELPHLGAQAREEPPWDQYHRTLQADRSPRQPSQAERSVHEFSQGGPLRIERVAASEPQEKREEVRGPTSNDHFMIDPALTGPPPHEPRRPFNHPSPMVDSAPMRPQPQEPRGLLSHPSPLVDPALSRPPLYEPQGPITNRSPMIDPALSSRPSLLEERGPNNHDTIMIDPALTALTRPLLHEDFRPVNQASPTFQSTQARSHPPWEAPSSPGAPDSRERGEPSPLLMPRDTAVDELSRKPRSRTSSIMSQSTTTEASPDISVAGESGKRKSNSGTKQVFAMKPAKGERRGSTRRAHGFKEHRPGTSRKSQGGKNNEGGPSVYRFRLSSIESTPATPWSNSANTALPRTSHANDTWPTQSSYGPPQSALPPPPLGYPYPNSFDHNTQHRNSFPQSGPPWAPQQQAQSPLYAAPQPPPPQRQPGGGPPPDQWPSPSVFAPPRPSQTPRNTQPAGPPPLAPATPDAQRPLGSGGPSTNHLPAFAQQQRNQEANPRRRAHSEIQGHSFKHWAPRNTNR